MGGKTLSKSSCLLDQRKMGSAKSRPLKKKAVSLQSLLADDVDCDIWAIGDDRWHVRRVR